MTGPGANNGLPSGLKDAVIFLDMIGPSVAPKTRPITAAMIRGAGGPGGRGAGGHPLPIRPSKGIKGPCPL